MLRILVPEITREQGIKLGRDEAHLGGKLHALLAQIQEVMAQLLVEENHGFSSQGAVLGTSEGEHVHSQVPGGLPQGLPQAGGGVGDAGAVHMQKHAALVGKTSQGLDFARLIHRSNFRGLGNGNDSGLHMVRIIDAVVSLTDGFDRQLAVGHRDGKKLASGKFLGCAAFVGVNVRGFAADDGVISVGQRFQAQAIGRRAVKNKEHLDVRNRSAV